MGSRFWVQRFTVKGLFATGEIKGKGSYVLSEALRIVDSN